MIRGFLGGVGENLLPSMVCVFLVGLLLAWTYDGCASWSEPVSAPRGAPSNGGR